MSDESLGGRSKDRSGLEREIVELISTGFFDGCVRMLGKALAADQADVEDAILDSVVRLLERDAKKAPIEDVRRYLYSAARNGLRRRLQFLARQATNVDEVDTEHPSAEQEVLSSVMYAEIVSYVKTWENARMRVVTLLYLSGIYEGDPLSIVEVATSAGEILGEEINVSSVGGWRKRGFDRLASFLATQAVTERLPAETVIH